MPECIAIQINQRVVQIAHARPEGEAVALAALHHHEVPEGADAMAEASALLQQFKAGDHRVAVVVDWNDYSIREQWLQLTSEEDIRSVLKYELADDLAADPQTLVMPFQIVEERPEGAHVIAWSTTKQTVADLIQMLSSAGLAADTIPPDAMGHVGLVAQLAPQMVTEPIIAVSGDEYGVNLSLLQNGLIWGHRRLSRLAWATDAAGQPLQEIRRMLLAAPGFPSPVAVVSFGPEAGNALAGVLAGELDCEHLHIAPPPQAGVGQAWPLVAGVAMAMVSADDLPLSFRLEEFAPKESARMVSMLGAMALGLLGVCLAVGGLMLVLQAQYHKTVAEGYEERAREIWQSRVDARPPALLSIFPVELSKKMSEIEAAVKSAQSGQDVQPVYRHLMQALIAVPDSVKYKIENITINEAGARLTVTTTNDHVIQLDRNLNQSPRFSSMLEADRGTTGETRYTLTLTYKPISQKGDRA